MDGEVRGHSAWGWGQSQRSGVLAGFTLKLLSFLLDFLIIQK